jgi:hypothetical protein
MSQPIGTTLPCEVHSGHAPHSHINDRHHVWPLGAGGPDIPENIVVVCPTGHRNIHSLLEQYQAHRGEVPFAISRRYALKERHYAQLGYDRITRGAM